MNMKTAWIGILVTAATLMTSRGEGLVGEDYYSGFLSFQKFGDDLADELFGMVTIVGGGFNRSFNEKYDYDFAIQYGSADLDYSGILGSLGVTRKFPLIVEKNMTPIAFGEVIFEQTEVGDSSDTDIGIGGGGGVEIVHSEKWFSRYTASLQIRSTNFLIARGNWGYHLNEEWTMIAGFGFNLDGGDVLIGLNITRKF